ncbi:MAG: hypothetical protein EOO88_23295 [Pedobacter sp.]|nr:MAG: hypothetical protein EOO88_23295 [Pedobacter sp.]
MAVYWQQVAEKNGMKAGSKHEFPYTPARLVENTDKPYVVYYAWDVQKKKKVRCRYRVQGDTPQERAADAKAAIKEINKNLKDGWHIDVTLPKQKEVVESLPEVLHKKITVHEAFQYYKQVKSKDLRTGTTMGLYSDYADLLFRFLLRKEGRDPEVKPLPAPKALLLQITPVLANEFMDSLTQGGRYRNNLLGWLKSFFKFFDMDHRGLIQKNPFSSFSNVPVDESDDHRPYTAEQATALRESILKAGDVQLWRFVQFAYFLFVRPGQELRLMKVGDLQADRVRIVSTHGKNRKIGYVDIPQVLKVMIEEEGLRNYLPSDYLFTIDGHPGPVPCGKNYFYKRHAEHLKTLKLFGLDYDLYSWKPTGAIALYRHTKDLLRVQRHCRHSSPDQTYTYLRKHGELFVGQDLTDFPAVWSTGSQATPAADGE